MILLICFILSINFQIIFWQYLGREILLIPSRWFVLTALERCCQRNTVVSGILCLVMVKSRSSFWTLSATMHFLMKSNTTTYMTRSNTWLLALLHICVQRCISYSLFRKLTLALLFTLFLNSWRLLSQNLVSWVNDAVIWKHQWCIWFCLVNSGWLLSGFTPFLD